MDVRKKLFELKDEKYKTFSSKLLPENTVMLGVRLPVLRALAKEIIKDDYNSFLNSTPLYMEEKLLKAMVIGLIKADFPTIQKYIENFIPEIDNWSVCDSFCASLKIVKKHKNETFEFIKKYLNSKKEYERRFALVILLDYFVCEEYLDKVFKILTQIKSHDYYVIMAAAWLFSICFVKYPEQSLRNLTTKNVQYEIYKKGVSKVRDSFRVSKELKEILSKELLTK